MRISRRTTSLMLIGILAAPATLGAKQIKPVYQTGHQIRAELGLSGESGWMLVDLASGDVIDASNGDVAFVPASVAKLPTAAYALDALGPDHRFETTVRATGTVSNGRLDGDLVLRGGGDPELDTDGLWSLVAGLAEQGVRSVAGRFIVDASALPQLSEIESTQGVDASYNPSISGLNLNFNRVHLKWDARKGKREIAMVAASQQRSPEVSGVRTVIDADPTAPLFALSVSEGRETWRMAARAFRGQASRWLPVKNPASYAAEVFGLLARDRGIRLPAPTDNLAEVSLRQAGPASAEPPIARHESRKLGTILRDMLRFSTNVTAEVTGSAATRSIGISAVDLRESATVMNAWAASVAGFELGDPGFSFANHSGLTLRSRVSPRRMVQLLTALGRRAADQGRAHSRLPGGIAGYLKKHNVAAKAFPLDYDRLEVVAKTGTMNFVRGLSGYIATPKGRRLAFAIFSNDLARRSGGAEKVNKRWMRRARAFERALIRNWVARVDGAI